MSIWFPVYQKPNPELQQTQFLLWRRNSCLDLCDKIRKEGSKKSIAFAQTTLGMVLFRTRTSFWTSQNCYQTRSQQYLSVSLLVHSNCNRRERVWEVQRFRWSGVWLPSSAYQEFPLASACTHPSTPWHPRLIRKDVERPDQVCHWMFERKSGQSRDEGLGSQLLEHSCRFGCSSSHPLRSARLGTDTKSPKCRWLQLGRVLGPIGESVQWRLLGREVQDSPIVLFGQNSHVHELCQKLKTRVRSLPINKSNSTEGADRQTYHQWSGLPWLT